MRKPSLKTPTSASRTAERRHLALVVALVALGALMTWAVVSLVSGGSEQDSAATGGEPDSPARQDSVSPEQVSQNIAPADDGTDAAGADDDGGATPTPSAEEERGETNGQRQFVSNFVDEAYGYTGTDVDAYLDNLQTRVTPGSYYASPAGVEVESYAKRVAGGGTGTATTMHDYRILYGPAVDRPMPDSEVAPLLTPQANEAVSELFTDEQLSAATLAHVEFVMGDRYGEAAQDEDPDGAYGDRTYYSQTLLLVEPDAPAGAPDDQQAEPAQDTGPTIAAGTMPQEIQEPEDGQS